jgi:hypothetical protein
MIKKPRDSKPAPIGFTKIEHDAALAAVKRITSGLAECDVADVRYGWQCLGEILEHLRLSEQQRRTANRLKNLKDRIGFM